MTKAALSPQCWSGHDLPHGSPAPYQLSQPVGGINQQSFINNNNKKVYHYTAFQWLTKNYKFTFGKNTCYFSM